MTQPSMAWQPKHWTAQQLEEWQQVAGLVRTGARTSGSATERWTLTRVAQLIQRTFAVGYHPNVLAERLYRLGLGPQQPLDSVAERRAQARAGFMHLGRRYDALLAFFHHADLSLTGLP